MRRLLFLGFIWLCGLQIGVAQTCCSGGVPISSNLGLPQGDLGAIQFSLSYDVNVLKTLKTGTTTLDDRNRNRTTHSAILETGYTFSRRISVDALFSYVRQQRNVNNFGTDQFTSTNGLGDATFLFKYLLLDLPALQINGGLGVKAPFGTSDKRSSDGITLSADLQPGSGAWDGIGWLYLSRASKNRPSSSVFGNLIYARKGHNSTYLGSQDYKFGNELVIIAGWGERALLLNQIVDVNLAFRYRNAQPDENGGLAVPSTGGSWIFANPGFALWFNQNISWQANVEIPLSADITGTQVTPTFRFNTGVFYRIPSSKVNLDL